MIAVKFDHILMLVFLLTWHESINDFWYKINLSEAARCTCSAVNEDWKYVLLDCVLYADLSDLVAFGALNENGIAVVMHSK